MQPVGDGQQPPIQNVWSTGLLECAKDEESCWWSSWCCCLVFSRNVETFGLGSTQTELNRVRLLAAIVFVLIILGLGPIAVLVLIGGLIVHAYYRADVRVRIRDKLGVFGTWMSDLTSQACCPCCSVAQEAREAMGTSLPALDYCSGQPLSEVHAAFASEEDFEAQPQAYSFSALYGRISKASLTLIKAWQVFLAILILVITITRPIHLITLVAIFLQPCLVMYFIYWRPRRQYAQLDFVIKFFTVGFFVSTLQSICLESVLEFLLGLVAAIVIAVLNQGAVDPSYVNGALWQTLELVKGSRAALLTSALHGFQMLTLPPPSSGVDYASVSAAGGLYGAYYVSDTAAAVDDDMSKQLEDQKSLMRRYIVLVFLYCFAMAFVVAAGTEETMKHFAVRCCRMQDGPGGLRRNTPPQAVMVYLLAAALGFATSENMEYVFGVHSRGGALNALVGELTVLALRLLTPVHLICAVIQAANLSKVVLGIANLHVVNILLPAIVLHGTFDFVLFFMGALQVAYDIESVGLTVCFFLLPFGIALAGLVYAVRTYSEVEKHYDNNWRVVPLYTGDEELAALPSSGSYAGSPSVTIQQPSRDVLNPMASPPASSAFNNQSGSSQDGSDVYV